MSYGHDFYWMAADCPNCGEKDEPGKWKGARMSGGEGVEHNFQCCSTACLIAYNTNPKRFERERHIARDKRDALNEEIERLSEKIGQLRSMDSLTKENG